MPPTFPRIVEAVASDADTFAAVHARSWRSAYRGFAPDDWLDSPDLEPSARRYWRDTFAAPPDGMRTWLALEGEVAVGFVNIAPPPADPRPDEEVPEGCGYLHHIHLLPQTVGRGVGTLLFGHACKVLEVAGFAEAVLWVYEPNERARGFYEAMGWRHDGTVAPHAFPSAAGPVTVPNLRYRGATAR
ncbi:MAG: GNAT family N-acetyltransferase [Dehalococcoidia bacterium]|nr:GNAT family N-acetyltransferase [Dehalococcoidia bacterium]